MKCVRFSAFVARALRANRLLAWHCNSLPPGPLVLLSSFLSSFFNSKIFPSSSSAFLTYSSSFLAF